MCYYVELCSQYYFLYGNLFCTQCIQKPGVFISLVRSSNNLRSDCVQNLPTNQCMYMIDDVCIQCQNEYVLIEETNICIKESEIGDYCFKANSSKECLSCVSGYRLVNGKCFKVNGSCSLRYTCTSTNCTIDCQGLYGFGETCTYNCLESQFQTWRYCYNCKNYYGVHCQKCTSKQCNQCDLGYTSKYKNGSTGSCLYPCENDSYSSEADSCPCNNSNCYQCDNKNKNYCTRCQGYKYLQGSNCVDKCSDEYFSVQYGYYDNYCYKCQDNCKKCFFNYQNPDNCSECKEGWLLENNKCVDKCSKFSEYGKCTFYCYRYVLDGQCVESCPSYYYNDKNIKYGEGNAICVDKCPNGLFQHDQDVNICTEQCYYGFYQDNSSMKCLKCQVNNCYECSQGSNMCSRCWNGYFFDGEKCKYICPNGLLANDSNNCSNCGSYCLNCDSPNKNCNLCLKNMIIQNNYCTCSYENGNFFKYPNQCLKCSIDNCQYCDSMNEKVYCKSCKSGYILFTDSDLYYEKCVLKCPSGFYEQYGYCKKCDKNCLECSYNGCFKCIDGYVPTSVYSSYSQCLYQCPNGDKQLDPSQCGCLVPNCIACDQDKFKCQLCEYNFTNYGDKCIEANANLCGNLCSVCDNKTKLCMSCISGYVQINGYCYYKCDNGEYVADYKQCNLSSLCQVKNCYKCSSFNSNVCLVCNSGFLIANAQCYESCPHGFYLDISKVCQPCSPLCETCSSNDKCDSCKISNKSNDCSCPVGQKLYKQSCIEKCPFYSTQVSNNFCIEHCTNGLYPVYTANKEQRLCQKVEDANSTFCLQNIENIPDILSFDFEDDSKSESYYFINIEIQQTPSVCYSLIMKGSGDNEFKMSLINENFELTTYQVTIPKEAIIKNLLDCQQFKCSVYLYVYFTEQLQYTFVLNLDFDISILLTNSVNYSGSQQTIVGVCPKCVIPDQLTISSKLTIQCPDNQSCSNESISTTTNSQIKIIQMIDDKRFLNNKLQPHSIRLEYQLLNGKTNILFISNYFYDNSVLGQITYTFKAISLQSGTLLVTSVCKSANKINSRILATSNQSDNVVYPQSKITFYLNDQQSPSSSEAISNNNVEKNVESENDFPLLYIILTIFGFILILILIFIGYKCYMKKQERKDQYKKDESITKKDENIAKKDDSIAQKDDESQVQQLKMDLTINDISIQQQQQSFNLKN